MSQQTIVAVAITLAVVAVILAGAALAAWSVAMAMTRGKQSHPLRGCSWSGRGHRQSKMRNTRDADGSEAA